MRSPLHRGQKRLQAAMVDVIGAGLAGSEAAWQIARRGVPVRLFEMKKQRKSPAHSSDGFAELVCSNSFRSDQLTNAAGLLKAEMELLDSLIVRAARAASVPAGGALAADRVKFSQFVTDTLRGHPLVTVVDCEVTSLHDWTASRRPLIVAAGPLCSDLLAESIAQLTGEEFLSFFDAVAPIVSAESVDMSRAFWGSRYGRGSDYINCPMNKAQYTAFQDALQSAQRAPVHAFEENMVFEGCMPIESMALRGTDTMRFGPLKPRGLKDPRTGHEPYAVVQLRKEDADGRQLNLVGFQTRLRFSEQTRIIRMIPGLENAEILRYGVMHRNTFLRGPSILDRDFRLKSHPWIRFAGQITGVEGYIESAASGLLAGLGAAREQLAEPPVRFDTRTALGAIGEHVSNTYSRDYQPSNINFGMIDPLEKRVRGKEERNLQLSDRALAAVRETLQACGLVSAQTGEGENWN